MNYKSRSVLRSTDFNIRKDFLNLCDKYPQIEFTNHGEFGYYVNPYDGKAISRIKCEIIVKREDLKVKALKGLDFFKSHYHFDSVSEKWYNAYKYLAK